MSHTVQIIGLKFLETEDYRSVITKVSSLLGYYDMPNGKELPTFT